MDIVILTKGFMIMIPMVLENLYQEKLKRYGALVMEGLYLIM
jgi:hypothetical protein